MVKPPSITQFNSWSIESKSSWIAYETNGEFRRMRRDQGYFPIIVYKDENVGIIYNVNRFGKIIEASAMTVVEAFERLETFDLALSAAKKSN